MRRLAPLSAAIIVVAAACAQDSGAPLGPTSGLAGRTSPATGPAGAAAYEVTVTNLTTGQPFTPPLAAVHRRSLTVFEVGASASPGVQEIAENGNLAPLMEALGEEHHVMDIMVAAGDPPPLLPGESRSFDVDGARGAKYLSIVSMLICTNDGFTGVAGVRLPKHVGDTETFETNAYDAGTELNTEDFGDLVPPCPMLTGVEPDEPGTGMSDPALAENGVIHPHEGILGIADLETAIHGWTDPVARIEITRVN